MASFTPVATVLATVSSIVIASDVSLTTGIGQLTLSEVQCEGIGGVSIDKGSSAEWKCQGRGCYDEIYLDSARGALDVNVSINGCGEYNDIFTFDYECIPQRDSVIDCTKQCPNDNGCYDKAINGQNVSSLTVICNSTASDSMYGARESAYIYCPDGAQCDTEIPISDQHHSDSVLNVTCSNKDSCSHTNVYGAPPAYVTDACDDINANAPNADNITIHCEDCDRGCHCVDLYAAHGFTDLTDVSIMNGCGECVSEWTMFCGDEFQLQNRWSDANAHCLSGAPWLFIAVTATLFTIAVLFTTAKPALNSNSIPNMQNGTRFLYICIALFFISVTSAYSVNESTCAGFYCAGSNDCIDGDWRCDSEKDCADGEDERGCCDLSGNNATVSYQINYPCSLSEFQCRNTTNNNTCCIGQAWLCDGVMDCPEGEDEDPSICTGKYICELNTNRQLDVSDMTTFDDAAFLDIEYEMTEYEAQEIIETTERVSSAVVDVQNNLALFMLLVFNLIVATFIIAGLVRYDQRFGFKNIDYYFIPTDTAIRNQRVVPNL